MLSAQPATRPFSIRRSSMLALLFTLTVLPCLAQEYPLPHELKFLYQAGKPYRMVYEPWAEIQMPGGDRGSNGLGKIVRGKHWEFPMVIAGKDRDACYALVKSAFLSNGWTTVHEWTAGGVLLFLHYNQNGVEAYAVTGSGDPERAGVEMVELAPLPIHLHPHPARSYPRNHQSHVRRLPLPQASARLQIQKQRVGPRSLLGHPQRRLQAELIAPGSIDKTYIQSDGLSNTLFRAAYHDALTKNGWTIVDERMGSDVLISAHYAQNGRNVWAALHKNNEGYDIRIADAGTATKDLSTDLAKNCHVAVYGILFDFNKSTLQPASDAVLQQILALLTKNAALNLEIQGHTDNVGGDAYNQTLSEARAHAVVAWLSQQGIPTARLTAKGYGRTVPIADNKTDEGRAKNRRVEIADPRCTAK